MPAKRSILIGRTHPTASFYRYVLWADVPAGNQAAYRNPNATSAYENATPAELQAIRDGLVAEKVGEYQRDSVTMTVMQTWLDGEWTRFQNEITAQVLWADYGRYSDNAGAWQASAGVPLIGMKGQEYGSPAFIAITPVSAYGINKFHFVLHNSAAAATGQACIVKVHLLVMLPGSAVVTGVVPSAFTLRRRTALSTSPSGTGSFSIASLDSAYSLPSVVTAYNGPQVAPAGGTLAVFNEFFPQADELKLSTLDAPTMAGLGPWGGQIIYQALLPGVRPMAIRAGETLEVQQSATAGTGNCRVLCLFTLG